MASGTNILGLKRIGTFRGLLILTLQALFILAFVGSGWWIYHRLPAGAAAGETTLRTSLQILIRQPPENVDGALDVEVSLYPVDIVAVRHEFFTDPRAGKRFEDFLKERMKGRSPVNARLDKQGQGAVLLPPGSWWLHATLAGEEQLEWRLPVTVLGTRQVIELTPQNAYTRSRAF